MIFSTKERQILEELPGPLRQKMMLEMAQKRRKIIPDSEPEQVISYGRQDVGPLPWANVNWERRLKCEHDLEAFCLQYRAETFYLPFCEYHYEIIENLEYAMEHGGNQAIGVPRSGGKTRLIISAFLKAFLYAQRWYILGVGAEKEAAEELCSMATSVLINNARIINDFPEVCIPFLALEREPRRAQAQKHLGRPTSLRMSSRVIRAPVIEIKREDVPAEHYDHVADHRGFAKTSGHIMRFAGLLSRHRGASATTDLGDELRPDFVGIDDPQTRGSSDSDAQIRKRLKVITQDLAYLGAPDRPCSLLATVTVLESGDVADQLLDTDLYPRWRGIRRKMLSSMPANMDAVNDYITFVKDTARTARREDENRLNNEYYRLHQEEIEEGAVATWPERKGDEREEISAIQFAIHLMADSLEAFYCEAQNDPGAMSGKGSVRLTKPEILSKVNDTSEGVVPAFTERICVAVDLATEALFYNVVASDMEFQASIVEVNTWPQQHKPYYTKDRLGSRLSTKYKDPNFDVRMLMALCEFYEWMGNRRFIRAGDNEEVPVDLILTDARVWGHLVQAAIMRKSKTTRARLIPYQGHGIGLTKLPMMEWPVRGPDDVKGYHWYLGLVRKLQLLVFKIDKYFWQTAVHTQMALPIGDPGSLSLFNGPTARHELIADHLTSEVDKYQQDRSGEYDPVRVWIQPPGSVNNEYFDTSYAALAGLSFLGCRVPDSHIFEIQSIPKELEPLVVVDYSDDDDDDD